MSARNRNHFNGFLRSNNIHARTLSDFHVGGAYTTETMTGDAELLTEYAQHRREAAFKELLDRHMALVYSTALRRVSDPQCARDIVQLVFIELAQHPEAVREP